MTEEPTPEQIEAGRKAVLANFHPPTDLKPTWHLNPEEVARAVLAAAAGAAPQEPTPAPSKYINPSLPGMIRNLWKSDPSEASVRTALGLAGDLIQELIDLRAAPVQVDEDELTEVIDRAERLTQLTAAEGNPIAEFGVSKGIAFVRGVRWAIEHLRGGGR